MNNVQIAETLEQLADLLEFQGANAFRVRAYRHGARAIRDLSRAVADILAENPAELTRLEGIGKGVAEKCQVLVDTGQLPQLDKLRSEVPESVLDLVRIPGLGPEKAAVIFKELGVASLDELRAACEQHRVRGLKGFGEKTEAAILDGLAHAATSGRRIYWCDAHEIAKSLLEHMHGVAGIRQMQMAGSYRRGRDTVGDLDLLVDADNVGPVMDHFGTFSGTEAVLARGDTKMSIRLQTGLQIDLRVVPAESFGAAWQYFTGSKEHNVELRGRARQRGLKINEYGVFRQDDEGEVYLAGASEADVYATLDLPCFPPEIREARFEFSWAEQGELPDLLTLEDLRGDLHMHTTATDGHHSLREMIDAAIARGLKYIAITDHSQRVSMARGLDSERLRQQWEEVDALNEEYRKRITVLKGIECDILEAGGMDLPDDVLAEADWVLASVHYGQKQPRQQITERILGAIENPYVSAIAHPTGRLLNRREAYDVDLDAIMDAAAEHHKLLELNANPARLDLNEVHCAAARDRGIPIVVSTDAHSIEGLDVMRYGVLQARRAGLTSHDVANTRTWNQLKKLLKN